MITPAVSLQGRACRLDLERPCIMGVLNVTPDSFSDGGRYFTVDAAVERGLLLFDEGAGIVDIGGESTRPGSRPVSLQQELDRVMPIIEGLRRHTDQPLSIDTSKSGVAREAITSGANFINDISGLSFDPGIAEVAAQSGSGLFLMHTRGRPEEMQKDTRYRDLSGAVKASLEQSLAIAQSAGMALSHLAVDPGIGFGKSVAGNLELLHHLDELHQFGCPVLLGTSRKSFIGSLLRQDDPRQRLNGTLATISWAVAQGVQLLRVHDVRPAREAALVAWAIREQREC